MLFSSFHFSTIYNKPFIPTTITTTKKSSTPPPDTKPFGNMLKRIHGIPCNHCSGAK